MANLLPPKPTKKKAMEYTHGEACPENTNYPCTPLQHAIVKTPSGKTLGKCARCKRGYILSEEKL